MSKNRVQFNTIVSSQLPAYVQEDFPLISDFLKQYYLGQEYQGGPIDLIQNIDEYIKLDNTTNLVESVVLDDDITFYATTINVDPVKSPAGTKGFPDSFGLLKIDSEVITYTGKTDYSFTGCKRGFVGITSIRDSINKEELVFESTEADDHTGGVNIENLSCLFLKEFLLKTKHQLLPGLENRNLTPELNQDIFVKQSKDFYLSKGTDRSFEILFKALYNKDVEVIRPSDYLFTPSNANYQIVNQLVVEPISGDPDNLDTATFYQDSYKFDDNINKSYAPITSVERIEVGYGKTYYRLNFDGGYNRDIGVDGVEYGDFKVEASTKVIGNVAAGSSIIDVDSTVGFGTFGELYVTYSDTTTGVVSYTSKSLSQFFGITNLTKEILDTETVGINTFSYGRSKLNQDEIIKVRISSVLGSINLPENVISLKRGTTANVATLGVSEKNFKSTKWWYNVAPIYRVSNVELVDSSDSTYKITLNVKHYLKIGNTLEVILKNGTRLRSSVSSVLSEKVFTIRGQGPISPTNVLSVQRKIQKGSSTVFPEIQSYSTDVQNVYKTSDDSYIVASPSLPSYNSQPIQVNPREFIFSGTFLGDVFEISPGVEHGFYTGDAVYYQAEIIDQNYVTDAGETAVRKVSGTGLFENGLYFVYRVNGSSVKFAKSRDDIFNSNFVNVDTETTVTNSSIKPYSFYNKTLKPQKILRKISSPKSDGTINETKPGSTGILLNGVEILNYKSSDVIKYGEIESVDILSPTKNVDVINPPNLIIDSTVGSGATGYVAVSGSVKEIRVLESGFDYISKPTLKIEGGNGQGAIGEVNLKYVDHSPEFFADLVSAKVVLGTASDESRIGFPTYHKFRNAEAVFYKTNGQQGIAGLTTNSSYFVSVIDNTTVRLHKTQSDSIAGINTVFLTNFGVGKHALQSVNKKAVVYSVNIVNGGSGYETKIRTSSTSGISTSLNVVSISNHDYKTGEIIKYTCSGTPIAGLATNTEYYVTALDKDSFKLSSIGISSDKEFYYRTKQYVDFTSVGVGTHTFNYPEITATLVGDVGISSIGTETFKASIQPIVRGTTTSIHIENGGVGYGSSEILNYDHQPQITISSGKNAQVKPIINNGKILQVIVLNSGSNYVSTPDLVINGPGIGAVLIPIIENESLSEVRVLEPGSGYSEYETTIDVITPFDGEQQPVFNANIKTWRVNLFEKNLPYFGKDDGVLVSGINELQYSHLYAPRVFRESVYSVDQAGKILYGQSDLRKVNSVEEASSQHSPILGFAYDGNPIYGPYGYITKGGGVISQMKSGYSLDLKSGRPPTSIFPEGFFVEDYTHKDVTDETILDENNGRFCVTPEYPEGTYAYFVTVNNLLSESSGVFEKYKKPIFPYIIGENYHSVPEEFNFLDSSNQDSYNFETSDLRRNTEPLNLIEESSEYPYIFLPNKLNQTIKITSAAPGTIDSIGIVTSGDNYKVGDTIDFNNDGTSGDSAYARVSKIKGKSVSNISVASSEIQNVEIYPSKQKGLYTIYSSAPHNLKSLDIVSVSGISTTATGIEGSYSVGISSNKLYIAGIGTTSVAIGTAGNTGLVTYFSVSGNIFDTRENDILTVGTEKIKVLNVDYLSSRLRVLRESQGTVSTAHTIGKLVIEDPRKLTVNSGYSTDYNFRLNEQIYFDPSETVGLGTTAGIGIGTTLSFSNPGAGATQIFIPTKSLYFRNHKFKTGDQITYSPGNGGSGIVVQDETNVGVGTTLADGQNLFVAKIDDNLIGIATVRVGLGTTGTFVGIASTHRNSTTLFITNVGLGDTHSFTTNHTVITGDLKKNTVTVSTASTHGLSSDHKVFVSVNPQSGQIVTVKYDDYNRRLLINPLGFSSTGINTSTGTITISDHGFKGGEKVIYTATDVSEGLTNEQMYYVSRVDENTIKLADTYYDATKSVPVSVGIASTGVSGGTISPVNPPISLYKDSTVTFDLSDSSLGYSVLGSNYPAFDLNLYTDKNFTEIWNKSDESSVFEYTKSGQVGLPGAKTTLIVNKNLPEVLYYKLDVIYNESVPDVKKEIISDDEVISGNQLLIKNSLYNGEHSIVVGTTTTFTYTLKDTPESVSYASTTAKISYDTNCTHALGPISEFEIINPGKNYYSLPSIPSVNSSLGSGAILEASSSTIGKLKSARLEKIGFNLPSDTTLRPKVLFPQTVKIEPLATFKSIGITSFGRGYSIPPKLVVIDGKTNKPVPDVDFRVTLGESKVEILRNTNGLSYVTPTIIPTKTDSGVGISTIEYFPSTKDVIVTLSVSSRGLFDAVNNTFPFSVGDKVLIENVSVGVGSIGKGYNSAGYDYKLFELTSVTPNLGGIGSVTFNMEGLFEDDEFPGQFNDINSVGRITPQKHFPIFNANIVLNDYLIGETIVSDSATGKLEDWDASNGILRISSDENFVIGEKLIGRSSSVEGIASSIKSYDSYVDFGAYSKVIRGWQNDSGELNYNLQRVQDNYYYQKFSYSLKSDVPYDTWNDVVSSTNHTLGYRKFGDYQLESSNENTMQVSIPSSIDVLDSTFNTYAVLNDINTFGSLHCVHDFDLATENNINQGTISDEINLENRILTDYFESFGNRVLSIDDISGQFNSEPRSTPFSVVSTFNLSQVQGQKYFTYVRDKRYTQQRQLLIVDLVHNGSTAYLNQYGRVETQYDQGSFDFSISGTEGQLLFYPTKYTINDYNVTTLSYNLSGIATIGTGSTSFGSGIVVDTSSTNLTTGVTTTIVSIASTYNSAKVLVGINPDIYDTGKFEMVELNVIHDGTNAELVEFGRLATDGFDSYVGTGFGTYYPYIDGSELKIDFIPSVGVATTGVVNTMQIGLSQNSSGIGTVQLQHTELDGRTTSISASGSPGLTTVSQYGNDYDSAYFVVQVADTTNGRYQMSEFVVVDDYIEATASYETYDVEFGNIETSVGLGTFGSIVDGNGVVSLVFTPSPSIDTVVTVFKNAITLTQDTNLGTAITFTNGYIGGEFGQYTGTESEIMRSFGLTHKNDEIFERYFEGNNTDVIDLTNNTITIPNHFFVSGEKIEYVHVGTATSAIGIATTSFVGASNTTYLPGENLYAVKYDDNKIQIATSALNALKTIPEVVELESVGIGTSHRFIATNQNAKVIVAIDNVIQSPIVATSVTTGISTQLTIADDLVYFSGITSFYGSDIIKINDEILKIEGVGIGTTNAIRVRRGWLGTKVAFAATGSLVTKISGNYNIVDNVLNFVEAPYGNTPIGSTTNPPDDRDWIGITTGSSFQGRSFMRSGIENGSNASYSKNYIFDNVSNQFNGVNNEFPLKQESANISGITNENAVILINDIFQVPANDGDYVLNETTGITTLTFQGSTPQTPLGPDVGISSFPKGGVIVSVASTEGFGYQPLVSAGGTAIVSGFGTISSISIGNSGSGYRSGIQTTVNVGVATSSTGTPNIEFIGTAAVSNGNIVSVAITNPGSGYTFTNPPIVVFDNPLSYSDVRLSYSSSSVSGVGSEATIDIVVGQGSSVIDFEIKNTGYGYRNGEILTFAIGGTTGIPTTSSYSGNEFQVTIDEVADDKFAGWSLGTLQVLDSIEKYIDGERKDFPLALSGSLVSIVASRGSKIDVKDVLIIFVNDILQIPGSGYTFNGGTVVTFAEPLKLGDKVTIIFYKGNGDSDVLFRNVIETIKKGDTLQLKHSSDSQPLSLEEDVRSVLSVLSTGSVETNPYFGPGNTNDVNLSRPVTWCRQTEDKIIDGVPTGKDRELYEPVINPSAYIIKSVGIGSTVVYVDTLRPIFDTQNEASDLTFQNKVKFIAQESKSGAAGTAVVSGFGTISSVVISDGGVGYSTATVSFASTVGVGTTTRAFGSVTISAGGTVTGIAITSPGIGYTYTNPPVVLISPPAYSEEQTTVNNYYGDNGIIVGFGSTSVGVGTTQLIFDIHIPYDSFLRNSTIAGTAVTITSIQANDYFIIKGSNVGIASTTISSLDSSGNTIGIGTSFADNVYEVSSVETLSTSVLGITTYVKRLFVNVDGFASGYSGISTSDSGFGKFSWGRLNVTERNNTNSYTAYTLSGVGVTNGSGISTSTMIVRSNFLKFKGYT